MGMKEDPQDLWQRCICREQMRGPHSPSPHATHLQDINQRLPLKAEQNAQPSHLLPSVSNRERGGKRQHA